MSSKHQRQVAVIGAGPGGYAAAFMAADLGLQTTLIDPEEHPGGVCLYRGCIPSKALLHAARLKREAAEAADFGMRFADPDIDLDRLRSWKDEVVGKLTGGLEQLRKHRDIEHLRGMAQFVDAHTLQVEMHDGDQQEIAFEHAIVATGSEPMLLPDVEGDSDNIMFSEGALDIETVPESLLIVGGGYIGLEMGTVYAALGSQVSVAEMTDGFLPGVDRDLVRVFAKRNESTFEAVHFETKVTAVDEKNGKLQVTLEDREGNSEQLVFDKILLAVGRRPRTAELGLDKTGVELDDHGFIRVNAQRRTAESSIYAIGDVTGQPMLAHKASHEGRIAAEVIAGRRTAYEPRAVPAVVYTDPEIAWCGLTETEAKEAGREVRVAKFPWSASGRAATVHRGDGLTKLLIDPDTERVLGAGIAGKNAGDLIAEAALAVEMAALASDLSLTIHPHPTFSETLMEAAEAFYGYPTHIYRKKQEQKA